MFSDAIWWRHNKSNMADGRHIENHTLAISPRFIVRLTRNFVWRSRITFRHRSHDQNTRLWKFKMADGRHFENGFIAISQPGIIRFQWNTRFWKFNYFFMPLQILQILVLRTVMWQSIKILQIQNGGRPPYWKSTFGYISAIYCSINAKFCVKK